MSDPIWPASLPQAGSMGVSGGPQANVVSFEPETGPTIDRRRSSTVTRIRDVELAVLTTAQHVTFVSFFENTLFSGVLPFTWVDPITGNPSRVKFVQKSNPPYTEEKIAPDLFKISFQIATLR